MQPATRYTLLLLFVTGVWGIEYVLVHNALDRYPPNVFNALRFGIAVAVIWPWLAYRRGSWRLARDPGLWRASLGLALLIHIGFVTQTYALLYTSVSNTAFITGLNIVLVPPIALLLLRDPLRLAPVVGIVLSVIGLYLMTHSGSLEAQRGDLLALVGALAFACHIVFTSRFVQHHDALQLTLVQLIGVTVLSVATAWGFEAVPAGLTTALLGDREMWLALFVAGVLGTALAAVAQSVAQQHIRATRVALIYLAEPIFAALAAWALIGERFTATTGAGAVLILIGILVAELPASVRARFARILRAT